MGWMGLGLDGIRVFGGIEHLTVLIKSESEFPKLFVEGAFLLLHLDL